MVGRRIREPLGSDEWVNAQRAAFQATVLDPSGLVVQNSGYGEYGEPAAIWTTPISPLMFGTRLGKTS